MTENQARQLKIETRVMWDGDRGDLGTVGELIANGFYVVWDNGQTGWIDFRDAEKIAIARRLEGTDDENSKG